MAVVNVADTFSRADSPTLGVTSSGGKTWVRLVGSASVSGGRASLNGAVAYLDGEVQDYDVRADITEGAFLVFRLIDGNDFWRVRHEARVVETGSTPITGTEYEWKAEYGGVQTGGHHAPTGNNHTALVTRTAWGSQSTDPTPATTLSLSHAHGGASAIHSLSKVRAYRTGATRQTTIGSQTTTRTDRYVHVEVVRNGVVQTLHTRLLAAGTTTVRVGAVSRRAGTVAVQVNQAEIYTTSSAEMASSTRAGVGSVGQAFADTFTLTPLEFPPTAPTELVPSSAAPVAVGQAALFTWRHNGPDAQSRYVLRVRKAGSAAWTTFDERTTAQLRVLPESFLSAGTWEWEITTYGTSGLASPVSARATFTATLPPDLPVITSPSGTTVGDAAVTVRWTASGGFDAYEVRSLVAGVAVYTSGTVVSGTAEHVVPFPVNGRTETLYVRVRRNGLWSGYGTRTVTVSYVPPPAPDHEIDESGPWLRVVIRNAAPSGGQPAAVSNELYRRVAGSGDTVGRRVALGLPPGGDWLDPHAGHLPEIEYAAVSVAQNGSKAWGPWEPIEPLPVAPEDGSADVWATGGDSWDTGLTEWGATPDVQTQGGFYGTTYGPTY